MKHHRPGYLRQLGDSWTDVKSEKELARRTTQALESQSTAFIDSRSGAARVMPMRGINTPTPARMSSPDFLIKNARWYDEYRRKVLG